jgi:hypothetical protein
MSSIKHYRGSHSLPDFRNFGVMLRILPVRCDPVVRLETRGTAPPGGSREYRVDIVLPCREPRS